MRAEVWSGSVGEGEEAGSRKQEAESRKQKAESRKQEAGWGGARKKPQMHQVDRQTFA